MDMEYVKEQLKNLLAIDSPSGYTKEATDYLLKEFEKLGFHAYRTVKGGVIAEIGGEDENNAVFLEAHVDTLGAMVTQIKGNGCLQICPVGGIDANSAEGETVRIRTRSGKMFDGTCQLCNASVHVNGKYADTPRKYDVMEVVVDEKVFTKEETEALGIAVGDFVCFEPRTVITESGYIKSRFLDDKLSAAILLGYAKHIREDNVVPERKIYMHMTVYEEVGHGGSASIPEGVTEVLSVDMGCVGEGLACREHQVSICAKDSKGPYNYEVVSNLIEAAKRAGADYAVDVYPHYGSDAEAALTAGYDVRHGLIGAGVYASHGYERSHVDGAKNTLLLLKEYLG
ncbi:MULTISPECIES: M42 family metallopeptidase [Sellimonas]|uniref:M42 family metallopeptidase n=1 Tax=Sellimonas caecigallum TaxID=2592333 RepID=A0ABS7L7I2_9FIRM|nr:MULTISPECIES: M42 family metallopeptidase [Sellimonas]MBY0758804.1 M42 family metallopeptidase [Sellimonas caecigallum]OUP01367.1 peptidase M42 [Drancourtella sp. An210]